MPEKILVIDDHEETIRVVTFILEQRGYEVISASSGTSGISIAEDKRPDLILLDVMMPDMNGVEVCKRLRADDRFNEVPIIMFTAKDQVDDKWAGFEAGADDYLTKPTDPEELDRRIQVLLRRAGNVEELFDDEESLTTYIAETPVAEAADFSEDELEPEGLSPAAPAQQPEELELLSNFIAVAGVRGGVGTTTVAINLAASLADNAGKTHLLDLDMVQGHIGLYLQQKMVNESLNDLGQLNNNLELARQWQSRAVPEGIGLHLLLSRSNMVGEWPVLTGKQIEVLVEAIGPATEFVVADVGRGLQPAVLPIIRRAGHLVICTRPERVSLITAKQFIEEVKGFIGPETAVHVLMITFGQDVSLPQRAVEEFIQHQLAAIVPISYKEMAQAANQNAPLVRLQPTSKAAEIFRKIVDQIVF